MSDVAVTYDPYSADIRENPYPVYQYLRDEAPIYRHPEKGFYVLSRFADVLGVLHDWETYSSAKGITLEGLPPDVQPEMITMDPPRHDDLRGLVKRVFTPKAISASSPASSSIADELVAALDPNGFDLVRDVAGPVPSVVICELLGIPTSDRPLFRGWIETLIRRKPDEPDTITAARAASGELSEYLAGQIAERRRTPTDDIIGFAVSVAEDGRTLDDEELLGFVRLLLVAGNETTINLIGNSFVTLARNPDERARLAADPTLTPNAVEEVLRFESPVPQLCRHTTRDTVHHGVDVAAGSVVVIVFAAANRDEREFTDPNRFDITRRVDRHLAFGHGIHHCLGAALARLQARAAIDAVLAKFPDYEITTDTIEMLPSGHRAGRSHFPPSVASRGRCHTPGAVRPTSRLLCTHRSRVCGKSRLRASAGGRSGWRHTHSGVAASDVLDDPASPRLPRSERSTMSYGSGFCAPVSKSRNPASSLAMNTEPSVAASSPARSRAMRGTMCLRTGVMSK